MKRMIIFTLLVLNMKAWAIDLKELDFIAQENRIKTLIEKEINEDLELAAVINAKNSYLNLDFSYQPLKARCFGCNNIYFYFNSKKSTKKCYALATFNSLAIAENDKIEGYWRESDRFQCSEGK